MPRSPTLSILLTILLITTGQASAVAPGAVHKPANTAPLPSSSDAGRWGLNQPPPFAPGVVLVGLAAGVSVSTNGQVGQVNNALLSEAFARAGVRALEPVFPHTEQRVILDATGEINLSRVYRLHLPPDADILDLVRDLSANPEVIYAEPDYMAHIVATPNDPQYNQQWGLAQIDAPAAWDEVKGSADVVIAIIDAGLDDSHPDLSSRLWVNPGEIEGNGKDDDNNGFIDDIHGWNLVDDNADLADNTGHGTQVAGIMAASTNNNRGIAGVCWDCRLMIVKVTQPGGFANYSDLAAGLNYAAQKGAEVINLSLGGYSDSTTLRAAIAAASQTAVVVGGAGNGNTSDPFYPAAYDDYVLAVAGISDSDSKVGTSNFGAWVDVSAPGENIKTTMNGGGYGTVSGTSMAAPFAVGLAGLVRSLHTTWSPDMVRAQIIHTADDVDDANPIYKGKLGSGRINAAQAVTAPTQPMLNYQSHTVDGELEGRPEPATTVDLDVALFNDWLGATNVQATLSTSDPNATIIDGTVPYGDIATYESSAGTESFRFGLTSLAPHAHDIPFTLDVTADGGYTATVAFTVTTAIPTRRVSGDISSDRTWIADWTYRVTDNVIVEPGVVLTIEPGTVVKFDSGKALVVRGTLIADGSADQPIQFTSASNLPGPGDWGDRYAFSPVGGIVFTSESEPAKFYLNGSYQSGSIVRYAVIEYSQGGIQLGSAAPFIDHNLLQNNDDTVIGCGACSSQLLISHNRILNNDAPRVLNLVNGQAEVRQNLIADNAGAVRVVSGHEIISNTITHNEGTWCHSARGAICVEGSDNPPEFRGNNVYGNLSPYDISMETGPAAGGDITASDNYWGTLDQAAIQARIYDYNQNPTAGLFLFSPFLTTPEPTAPGFLDSLSTSPSSPIGIQQVAFDLTFSRPMDQSMDPSVAFHSAPSGTQAHHGTVNPGLPYNQTESVAVDDTTALWRVDANFSTSAGEQDYPVIDNAQWVDSTHWHATFDVTSLVPRGTHTITVSGARDTDGTEIPPDTRFSLTVDYAGEITDQTPPPPPSVSASGVEGDTTTVEARWSAKDPESLITGYRYAVGSAAGATDIVNWTPTSSTTLTRSGLGLVEGHQYWLAVQARNVGGLWSPSGYGAFVSGQPNFYVFLPVVLRNQ
jgi:subtilisin family serine protease